MPSPGDIFFFLKDPSISSKASPFVKAVCSSSTSNPNVFHVGIFIDSETVVHAITSEGVVREAFTQAISTSNPDIIEIYHLQSTSEEISKALAFVNSVIGAEYNDIFSPDCINSRGKRAYYCCQLICEAYGRQRFEPHTLNFNDKNGNLIEYWIEYFKDRSAEIPQGLPGSQPSVIRRSKNMKLIGTITKKI